MEEHISKQRTAVWLSPKVIRRIDGWLEEDNCKTRSEFIEKALRFYMGYLATEDTTEFLSRALVDTLRGIVEQHDHRLRCLLFKWSVEQNMMAHTIAAHCGRDRGPPGPGPAGGTSLRALVPDAGGDLPDLLRGPAGTPPPLPSEGVQDRAEPGGPGGPAAEHGDGGPH